MSEFEKTRKAQVHRFHDRVAVWIGGETVYFTAREANDIARAMNACATDIRKIPDFSQMRFGTFNLKEKEQ